MASYLKYSIVIVRLFYQHHGKNDSCVTNEMTRQGVLLKHYFKTSSYTLLNHYKGSLVRLVSKLENTEFLIHHLTFGVVFAILVNTVSRIYKFISEDRFEMQISIDSSGSTTNTREWYKNHKSSRAINQCGQINPK